MVQRVYDHANSRQVADIVNQIVSQFDGNTGSLTLATSGTTTTVTNAKVMQGSRIFLQPRTAAAVIANAFVLSVSKGSFVVQHSAGTAERKFDYAVFDI
ncbi:hypothetical protein [Endobacterium cereale]|uniref:hypothetical protein n=1 Tax=Endobacterium cereale TaxID=2663029 RepID=UPI002B4914F2|nr:hypothetical protein [Endobacterium cereale]MEB2843808.1 hypothetical protein [Endobacterium cereale]